ncbi:uncharacterized protein [Dermacentor albipictus]|uniref:uncharacterized protein n=1 Tax=Dermacentor albipictus TaxID=60249 RepID=UPI0031FC2D9E
MSHTPRFCALQAFLPLFLLSTTALLPGEPECPSSPIPLTPLCYQPHYPYCTAPLVISAFCASSKSTMTSPTTVDIRRHQCDSFFSGRGTITVNMSHTPRFCALQVCNAFSMYARRSDDRFLLLFPRPRVLRDIAVDCFSMGVLLLCSGDIESNPGPPTRSQSLAELQSLPDEPGEQMKVIFHILKDLQARSVQAAKSQSDMVTDIKAIKASQKNIEIKIGAIEKRLDDLEDKTDSLDQIDHEIATIQTSLHLILDTCSMADCIFLDYSKAFDKVSHKLLLHKLQLMNIDPKLLAWIECFLKNRSQYVSANNLNSHSNPVHSGVPQGSVLGPLLFLIYINDLPSSVSSHIHLFADDCVIFREITSSDDVTALQTDLNAISLWCKTWLMELNITKCKSLRVSRTCNSIPTYSLDHVLLESVSSYKYLGVHITSTLTWSAHITFIINNANRMLGYIRRNFSKAPSSLKLLLYKTLIRPKLEYAASIWDPHHENLIHSLEMVQNNSVRFILSNYNRTASISSMKSSLNLPSLASRRKAFRICLFHKMFHHPHLRSELIPPPRHLSSRLDHAYKVGVPFCRTNAFFQSFIPRTAAEWNRLPALTATIKDYQLFKNALANIV